MAEKTHVTVRAAGTGNTAGLPTAVDRDAWQAEIDALRVREKAYTHEGDAIAAARRRLPMVEVDAAATLVGSDGPVALRDVFEGRRQLIAYYHMWHPGKPAAGQCEGCTLYNGHVRELSYLHSRDVTYATFCQGPYEESVRYRDFMGWDVPWYSVRERTRDRGDGQRLPAAAGQNRLRSPGGMGGLTARLAAATAP